MGISKNNPGQRQVQAKKMYQGKELRPTLYVGKAVGNGTYMTGAVDGELICDASGKPLQLRAIPLDQI